MGATSAAVGATSAVAGAASAAVGAASVRVRDARRRQRRVALHKGSSSVRLEGARQLLLVEGARLRTRGVDAERALALVRLHPRSARRASARLVATVDQRAHHRVFRIVLGVREARAVR